MFIAESPGVLTDSSSCKISCPLNPVGSWIASILCCPSDVHSLTLSAWTWDSPWCLVAKLIGSMNCYFSLFRDNNSILNSSNPKLTLTDIVKHFVDYRHHHHPHPRFLEVKIGPESLNSLPRTVWEAQFKPPLRSLNASSHCSVWISCNNRWLFSCWVTSDSWNPTNCNNARLPALHSLPAFVKAQIFNQ